MSDTLNLIIGFLGGIATATGSYIAYRQYLQNKPSIELVDSSGSGLLSPEAEKKGHTWRFSLMFQNRSNVKYAISDIFWTPKKRKLRKLIPHHVNGWQTLMFDGVLERVGGRKRMPLEFEPYEFKTLEAHWNDFFVNNPHSDKAKEYWEKYPEEFKKFKTVLESLHKQKILFKVEFADGSYKVFNFK